MGVGTVASTEISFKLHPVWTRRFLPRELPDPGEQQVTGFAPGSVSAAAIAGGDPGTAVQYSSRDPSGRTGCEQDFARRREPVSPHEGLEGPLDLGPGGGPVGLAQLIQQLHE